MAQLYTDVQQRTDHHISEFTHALIGTAIGRKIIASRTSGLSG